MIVTNFIIALFLIMVHHFFRIRYRIIRWEEKIQDLVKRVKAKTFHDDFEEQLDTVEELYGRQIRFHFDRAIVEKTLQRNRIIQTM